MPTRRAAAEYLDSRLDPARGKIAEDFAAWSWLGMFHFLDIVGSSRHGRVSPQDAAFVVDLSSRGRQKRYRHYLWGAWRLLLQHRGQEGLPFLLAEPLTSWSDLDERVFGNLRIFNSVGVVPLIVRLYTRGDTRKKGYKGSPGGLRHLVRVLEQLEMTHDVYGMETDALIRILPEPFHRWIDEKERRRPRGAGVGESLVAVRNRVLQAGQRRVDLRQYVQEGSAVWDRYTSDHGVPGYKTRLRTVVGRLNMTIERLDPR